MKFKDLSSIKDLILAATEYLKESSQTPKLDSELLLCHVLGVSKIKLIVNDRDLISADQRQEFLNLLERRKNYEPVAYILGVKEFYGREFIVDKRVLIPRPETEILVEYGLKFLTRLNLPSPAILDLGVGSGAICITLYLELVKLGFKPKIVGVDLSTDALAVAKENLNKFEISNEINLLQSSWFSNLSDDLSFDLIVSNPPYIDFADKETSPELKYEPSTALYASDNGTSDICHILNKAKHFLNDHAELLIEVGHQQHKILNPIYEYLADLSGIPRVCKVSKNQLL